MTDDIRQEGIDQWVNRNEDVQTKPDTYAGENDYKLEAIEIESPSGGKVDISQIFTSCSIFEDIFSNTISCSLSFHDTNNIARHLPINGQKEKLTIRFKIPSDKDISIEYKFVIYRVSVKQLSTVGKKQSVTIKAVSEEQFKNIHTRFSKSFYKKIDEMVSEIFEENLKIGDEGQHKLNIDSTTASEKRKFIIPNWHPFDAINWLAERAVDDKGDACHYLFFQNQTGFHFTTIEKLFEDPQPKQGYLYMPRKYREAPADFRDVGFEMRNLQRIELTEPGDRLDENLNGMYGSRILTHDIVRKKYETKDYSLDKEWEKTEHVPQPDVGKLESYPIAKSLDEFSDKPNTFFNFAPIHKTLNQENELHGGDTVEQNEQYSKWLLKRKSLLRQIGATTMTCTVSGDSRRMVGDIIYVQVTPLQPIKEDDYAVDKYISGNYLVTGIRHNLTPSGYLMDMEISKDNVNDLYVEESKFLEYKETISGV